jgi:hypothetical protein
MNQPLASRRASGFFSGITPLQELLLETVILRGEPAMISWREWLSRSDLNRLDAGSRNLLPLVYYNLQQMGASDPELKKLKGVMRLNWTQNQLRLARCKSLLQALHNAGIPILLLKGAALLIYYYENFGLRRMGDIDILVPAQWQAAAMDILNVSGWQEKGIPRRRLCRENSDLFYALAFENAAGDILDLHWHVMIECTSAAADDHFWKNALCRRWGELPVRILHPADQLLHTCVHGIRHFLVGAEAQSITWIPDAMAILNSGNGAFDFARLQCTAQKFGLVLALQKAMTYLAERFAVPIPPDFLHHLKHAAASELERREFRIRTRGMRAANYLPCRWVHFLRHTERWDCRFRLGDLAAFGQFMRRYYGLRRFWQLPLVILLKIIKKIAGRLSAANP